MSAYFNVQEVAEKRSKEPEEDEGEEEAERGSGIANEVGVEIEHNIGRSRRSSAF